MISDAERKLLDALTEQAAARPATTSCAYAKGWCDWSAWAGRRGTPAMPADPEHLALWLVQLAERCKPATVRLYARGVAVHHQDAGLPSPLVGPAAAAVPVSAGVPHQARPVTREELPRLLEHSDERMTAVILSMRYGLLRRSEAAALLWSDWSPQPDGSAVIVVRSSKTSKGPETRWLPLHAADALVDWLMGGADGDDPRIFGWSAASLGRAIAVLGRRAGLEGISGHSLRRGAAIDLRADGASNSIIQEAGRWNSESMVTRYTAGAQPSRPWIEGLSQPVLSPPSEVRT